MCGESAALVHVAGDLKRWPAMRMWLRSHSPPWETYPAEDALVRAVSRDWWGGDRRHRSLYSGMEREAYLVAKTLGLNAEFTNCVTIRTFPHPVGEWKVLYHKLQLIARLPLDLSLEFTAEKHAYVLLGIGGHSGLEIVLGAEEGEALVMRLIRSTPDWVTRGDLVRMPEPVLKRLGGLDHKMHPDVGGGGAVADETSAVVWNAVRIKVSEHQHMDIDFHGRNNVTWAAFVPKEAFQMLQHDPLTISVASQSSTSVWGACLGDPL